MLNEVQLIGRVGKDPEARSLPDGTAVVTLSIATSEKWKDKQGEVKESTEWHNVVAYGKLAEIMQAYLKKGSLVFVRGSLRTRSYEKDGVKKYSTEIKAVTMKMLGGNPAQKTESAIPINGDDLPF